MDETWFESVTNALPGDDNGRRLVAEPSYLDSAAVFIQTVSNDLEESRLKYDTGVWLSHEDTVRLRNRLNAIIVRGRREGCE